MGKGEKRRVWVKGYRRQDGREIGELGNRKGGRGGGR